MPKYITHDLPKEKEIIFDYSPDVGYLALVDLDSYKFFVKEELGYDDMLSHLGTQTINQTCVAWGCPETNLRVRVIFAEDHTPFELVTEYASGFRRFIRTNGRLCFTNHGDLYHCAVNPKWSVFKGPDAPACFLPRVLQIPSGLHSVIVFRHFGWFESDQDAPLLNDGIHYTVILRHYANELHLGQIRQPSPVPWT